MHAPRIPVRRLRPLLPLLLVGVLSTAVNASGDGVEWIPGRFSPRMDAPQLEGAGMPRGMLIARVDRLERELSRAEGLEEARLCYAIAEAYLATDLIKHHRTALEYLERAQRIDPGYFEAGRLSAATTHAMRYDGQAKKLYEQLSVRFSDRAEGWYLLGGFYFTDARFKMDQDGYRSSASAFSRAVAADSTHVGARMGLASSLAALNWYEDVPQVLAPIVLDPEHGREARFLRACALTALEKEDEAWADFHSAMEGADEDLRAVLIYGDGFFEESFILEELASRLDPALLAAGMRKVEPGWVPEDGLDAEIALRDSTVRREANSSFWRTRNPRPTHLTNLHQLDYWKRIIEAEMFFGRPEEGIRGWNREPGAAWVRFGRPVAMVYMAGGTGGRLDDLAPFRLDYGIVLPDPGQSIWVWAYDFGGYRFTLLFTDGAMNGRWLGYVNTTRRLRLAERQMPVVFNTEMGGADPSLRMEVSVAAFHRPRGATTLETYLSIETLHSARPGLPPASLVELGGDYVLEWAIFDEEQRRIEYRQFSIGEAEKESVVRKMLGRPPRDQVEDPYLVVLPADLDPGVYRLALDVTSMLDGYHESRELALEIPTRSIETLAVSDLQLATIFEPFDGRGELPAGMLKHAFAVLPAPGGVFPHDAGRLYVYYEVYSLCRDELGATHFDVRYEVYRRKDKNLERAVTRRDVAGLDPVDPLGLTYLEETTGTSAQQHVVKGGAVDLEGLEAGNYVLAVTITDRHCGLIVESYAAFAKSRAPRSR